MRCLNCNSVVADTDPRCFACGAQCTTPVREEQTGIPTPWVGLLFLFGGMVLGFVSVAGRLKNLATNTEAQTVAFGYGLGGSSWGCSLTCSSGRAAARATRPADGRPRADSPRPCWAPGRESR
jgi:hypothetical protein